MVDYVVIGAHLFTVIISVYHKTADTVVFFKF